MSVFGDWVRQTRRNKGYTQKECADRAGMQYQNWSRWERGGKQVDSVEDPQPERETAIAFARGLQVPEADALKAAGYLPDPLPLMDVQNTRTGEVLQTSDSEGNPVNLTTDAEILRKLDLADAILREVRQIVKEKNAR